VIASVVDTHALLQVVWVSLLAGVGLPAAYGFGLLGTTRAIEYARGGRPALAVGYATVGAAGLVIVVAAIVFGILILIGD
jgi:hypothetical protein